MQVFNTKFILSKEYLGECFDESLPHGKKVKNNYAFALVCLVIGLCLLFFTSQPKVIGTMLIALGVLELIHIRFQKAWWLFRQMWSRSANSQIELTIDSNNINTQNPFTKTSLAWADVVRIIETQRGLILVAKSGGQQYLSKSLFPQALIDEMLAKANTPKS